MTARIYSLAPEHTPPATSQAELSAELRRIADEIDHGDYPEMRHVGVILDSGGEGRWVEHRTIGHFTQAEWMGVLYLLLHRQAEGIL